MRALSARSARLRSAIGGAVALSLVLAAPAATSRAGAPAHPLTVSAGDLLSFGLNAAGELGITANSGTYNANPTPSLVDLPGAAGIVTEVAVGGGFSLAVTSSDQLYSWGADAFGQLGTTNAPSYNSFDPDPTPALIQLPGQVGTITEIAAGTSQSYALTSSGQLYSFGDNIYGALGIATNSGMQNPNPTPTLVVLPGQVGTITEVAAGDYGALVVTSSGQLYAFGNNSYGQLGNSTGLGASGINPNPTPTLVSFPAGTGAIVEAAAGQYSSFAVSASGELYSFGLNQQGQLGQDTNSGSSSPNTTPAAVLLPKQDGKVTAVAAGGSHTLVLTASGQLYSFGDNHYGQLGRNNFEGTDVSSPTPTLVSLPGQVGTIVQIAATELSSFVVTSSGQLYAFGWNHYGQLGISANSGSDSPNPLPTLVTQPPATKFATVADGPGGAHSLAIVAGLAITSGGLPSGRVGSPYSGTVSATGGSAPLSWSASGLPPGVTIGGSSGTLSGTPTASGTFTATITVTDSAGDKSSVTFTVVIAPSSATSTTSASTTTTLVPRHHPHPRVAIESQSVVVAGDLAPVSLSCRVAACRGAVELVEREVKKNGLDTNEVILLAAAGYRLKAGRGGSVELRLTPAGRTALAHAAKTPMRDTVVADAIGGNRAVKTVSVS